MVESSLLHYLAMGGALTYVVAFVGMIIEGDALLFTLAFLTSQGYFNIYIMTSILFSGVILGDLGWYWLGHGMYHSRSRFAQWIHRLAQPLDRHLLERPRRTIFISKFTYGVHHAVLIRAGAMRLSIKEFVKDDTIATTAWIGAVGGLGYISGASYTLVKHYIKFAEVILLIGLLLLLLASRFIFTVARGKTK